MPKSKAFISMSLWGSKVTINNTIFRNFLFPSGIITNTFNVFTKIFMKNHNIHDNMTAFSCRNLNSSFGDCHSINITNSVFDGYNAGNISFYLPTPIFPTVVNAFTPTTGVEAFIIRVRSLDGPITIKGCTFKNMITLKRDSQIYTPTKGLPKNFCFNSRASSDSDVPSLANIGRHIRKLNYLFKQLASTHTTFNLALSLSTSIDIRNLQKGLVLYQNTFQSIYATAGPVLHLYGFENTLSKNYLKKRNSIFFPPLGYPIIIDSNIIQNNQAVEYATAFYIAKTGPDYHQLGCDGKIFNYSALLISRRYSNN